MSREDVADIDAAINTAANLPAVVTVVLAVVTLIVYTVGSRGSWRRSLLGVAFAGLIVVLIPIGAVVFGRRFGGDYAGYGWVALGGWTFAALIYAASLLAIIVEQRRGNAEARPPVTHRHMKENDNG